jgi:hypothetical protein
MDGAGTGGKTRLSRGKKKTSIKKARIICFWSKHQWMDLAGTLVDLACTSENKNEERGYLSNLEVKKQGGGKSRD